MCTSKRGMASKAGLPSQPAVRPSGSLGDKARGHDLRSWGSGSRHLSAARVYLWSLLPTQHPPVRSGVLPPRPQTLKVSVNRIQGICDLAGEENLSHLGCH